MSLFFPAEPGKHAMFFLSQLWPFAFIHWNVNSSFSVEESFLNGHSDCCHHVLVLVKGREVAAKNESRKGKVTT